MLAASEIPFQQAAAYIRPRGVVVAIGLPAGAFLKAPVFSTVVRMIQIRGSYVGNRQDGIEAIEFFRRGLINAPFKKAPLSELAHIFELMGIFPSSKHSTRRLLILDELQNKERLLVVTSWKSLNRIRLNWIAEVESEFSST